MTKNILVKRTINMTGHGENADAIAAVKDDKKAIFKNCAPFIDCRNELDIIPK